VYTTDSGRAVTCSNNQGAKITKVQISEDLLWSEESTSLKLDEWIPGSIKTAKKGSMYID